MNWLELVLICVVCGAVVGLLGLLRGYSLGVRDTEKRWSDASTRQRTYHEQEMRELRDTLRCVGTPGRGR